MQSCQFKSFPTKFNTSIAQHSAGFGSMDSAMLTLSLKSVFAAQTSQPVQMLQLGVALLPQIELSRNIKKVWPLETKLQPYRDFAKQR